MAASNNPYLGVNNPYVTAKVDQAQGDLVRNWNMTAQPAYNTAMANSGSFGNAGLQQLNENGQQNLQRSLGDISTNLRGQDFRDQQSMYQWDQNFDRQVYNDAFGQNQQNLQTGIGLLGTLSGLNQQDIGNTTTYQNTPLNYWQQFSQGANSLGQGFGTTNNVLGTSSNPAASALGGAQLGSSLWNRYSTSGGYAANPASASTVGHSTSPSWDAWSTGTGGMGD